MVLGQDTWQPIVSMAHCRTGVGASVGPDGCLYVAGGSPDGSRNHRSAERFDPREGKWSMLPRMTLRRGYCSATFCASGLFYVSGGIGSHDEELQSVECFDPAAGKWICVNFTKQWGLTRADHASIWTWVE
uniref:Uncharacterized protein n=1 Tax=Rhizochromulina marina TaxID=1034831 RepID=A0A7S2RVT2_9STRA